MESTAQGVRQHTVLLRDSPLSRLPLMCYQETLRGSLSSGDQFFPLGGDARVLQITQLGGFMAIPLTITDREAKPLLQVTQPSIFNSSKCLFNTICSFK